MEFPEIIYITANAKTATAIYLKGFPMTDERKVIDGNVTWTFVIPPERNYAFRELRTNGRGRILGL
jgi:hypothetical protein